MNNSLLGFTTDVTYTYTSDNPYGTYKVITGYKNMTTNRSSGSTVELNANVTFQYNDVSEITLNVGDIYTNIDKPITVLKDGIDCTNLATIKKTIMNTTTNSEVTKIDTSAEGSFSITYSASYLGESNTFTKKVYVKKAT